MTQATTRQKQDGIVGGHVAVDGERVERALGGGAQNFRQFFGGGDGVGHDEAERGGHLRMNHAGAFGHARYAHASVGELHFFRSSFRARVGGHDRFGHRLEAIAR
jgi:hypothetical protein